MGSLASGIFDLISGNPTQGEQNALGSLGNYESNTGEGAVNAGLGFNNAILSGNPEAIAQVEAPEIRAGQDQIQQTAEQNAMFGNRGGGTNSSTQAAQSNQRGNIINLTGELQQGAAQSDLSAGQGLLGQSSGNYQSEAQLAAANQARQSSDVGGIAQGAAQIASSFLGGGTPKPPDDGGDGVDMLANAQNGTNFDFNSPETYSSIGSDLTIPQEQTENFPL